MEINIDEILNSLNLKKKDLNEAIDRAKRLGDEALEKINSKYPEISKQ